MNTRRIVLTAFAVATVWTFASSDADAWRFRRWRSAKPAASTNSTYSALVRASQPSAGSLRNYSGVSRAEYDYWRRRDAWYDHAYNGFDPLNFR